MKTGNNEATFQFIAFQKLLAPQNFKKQYFILNFTHIYTNLSSHTNFPFNLLLQKLHSVSVNKLLSFQAGFTLSYQTFIIWLWKFDFTIFLSIATTEIISKICIFSNFLLKSNI